MGISEVTCIRELLAFDLILYLIAGGRLSAAYMLLRVLVLEWYQQQRLVSAAVAEAAAAN